MFYAQDKTIDSLKLIVQNPKNNFEKIKTTNLLCENIWLKGNYTEARQILNQNFTLIENELKQNNFNKKELLFEKAYAYNNLAIIYRFQGDYSNSLDNHLIALKIREEIGDKLLVQILVLVHCIVL